MSSLRRGHANLLCIVPMLKDDPRRKFNLRMVFVSVLTALRFVFDRFTSLETLFPVSGAALGAEHIVVVVVVLGILQT